MLISKAHRILFQKEFVKINNIVVHTGNNVIYFKAPKQGKNILISYLIPNDKHWYSIQIYRWVQCTICVEYMYINVDT